MNNVIRLKKETIYLIEDLKKAYVDFYKNAAQTKNESLKKIAETELVRCERYTEQDWIRYALYRTLTQTEEMNKEKI